MASDVAKTDPLKLQLIIDLLSRRFTQVINQGAFCEEFVVIHNQESSQLAFALDVLDDRSLEELKMSMLTVILPVLLENPGKRISVFTHEVNVGRKIEF